MAVFRGLRGYFEANSGGAVADEKHFDHGNPFPSSGYHITDCAGMQQRQHGLILCGCFCIMKENKSINLNLAVRNVRSDQNVRPSFIL